MRKQLYLLFILFILFVIKVSSVFAQTYEDYIKQQKQEQQEYIKKEKVALEKFKQERDEAILQMDEEYREYLRQEWENFNLFKARQRDSEPKPTVIPPYEEKTEPKPKEIPVKLEDEKKSEIESVRLPLLKKTIPEDYSVNEISFWFYGQTIDLKYDQDFMLSFKSEVDEEHISEKWELMSQTNYKGLIDQLEQKSIEMNLNDWGYYLLIKNTVAQIASDENAVVFLTWFLLTKSNYKARLAFRDNKLLLLLPFVNTLFGRPFFKFDNLSYYLLEGQEGSIYTYRDDFPEARIIMDLNIYSSITLPEKVLTRNLIFDYNNKQYKLDIKYNQNVIDFYQDYPQADIKVYFDAAMPSITRESISEALLPIVSDMSEQEAALFLLRFVQTAFNYETDDEQFGYEKFFFPEELFHFKSADCEDRSVLYAYLVSRLLNLDVVGLDYPGHMATAVHFNADVSGDYIMHRNIKYVICDPTYIMAPIGKTMPLYANAIPTVVELERPANRIEQMRAFWRLANEHGLYQGSNIQNYAYDSRGSLYVCGYFNGELKFHGKVIRSVNNSNDAFFAKVLPDNKVEYLKSFGGPGNDIAYHIQLHGDENIYLAGIFSGQLKNKSQTIQSETNADLFLASYNAVGDLNWLTQAGIGKLDPLNNTFVINFDREGNQIWKKIYEESESFNDYGILVENDGSCFLTGSVTTSTGMDIAMKEYEGTAAFAGIEYLKTENDRLIEGQYHKSIAGLFAVVRLIQNSGKSLPGKQAQNALDKYNPEFRKQSPNIYENIGRIEFIKNSEGIVSIRTYDGKDVNFDAVRIRNNSKLKIAMYKSGNAQIDILSGIKVGKAVVWYDLNFVRLYKISGDLLFDYSLDHSQKKVNMAKDILM